MKKYLNKKSVTIAAYALFVILFAILFWVLVANLSTVLEMAKSLLSKLGAVTYGLIFALLFFPFERAAEKIYSKILCRKKDRARAVKALSIVTVYIVFFMVIAIVFTMVIPPMLTTVTELRASIITSINSTREWLEAKVEGSYLLLTIYNNVTTYIYDELLSVDTSSLASQIQALSGKIFGEISNIVIGLIISIYLIASRKYVGNVFAKALSAVCSPSWELKIARFLKRLYTDFTEFLSARILCSLYISSITFLVCRIAGIPFYPLIFIILLVLGIVPVFGPVIGSLLTMTLVFVTHREHAMVLLITILVTQLFESFIIEPAMLKKKLRPEIGTIIVVTLISYALLGGIGAIISIPLFCTVSFEIRTWCEKLLCGRGLPVDVKDFRNYNPLKQAELDEQNDADVKIYNPTESEE